MPFRWCAHDQTHAKNIIHARKNRKTPLETYDFLFEFFLCVWFFKHFSSDLLSCFKDGWTFVASSVVVGLKLRKSLSIIHMFGAGIHLHFWTYGQKVSPCGGHGGLLVKPPAMLRGRREVNRPGVYTHHHCWRFPSMGDPPNGWFITIFRHIQVRKKSLCHWFP